MNKYFFLPLLMVTFAYSEPVPIGPISFSKGLQIDKLSTLIDDEGSPDLCNCVPSTLEGSLSKKNGSKRYISQAMSSSPATSLYWAYSSTESGNVKRGFFA